MRGIVGDVLSRWLNQQPSVSSTQLARAAGISRQAAHKHLTRLVEAGQLTVAGKARAARYARATGLAVEPTALRTRLEVATAGSSYRLSARLLLDEVHSGEVTLDFTGVTDVGEEFLDEVFLVWAPAHPQVNLKVDHLPARFAPMLFELARKDRERAQVLGATG